MITSIKFYINTSNQKWYAHLPEYLESGGTIEECEMVAGADQWLDILSQGENEITLTVSDSPFNGSQVLDRLENVVSMYDGSYYKAQWCKGIEYNHILWLCPVTLFVFGKYPDKIYYA